MADGRHFENRYSSISQPQIVRIWRNLVCRRKFCARRRKREKNQKFPNSRWRTDAILKIIFLAITRFHIVRLRPKLEWGGIITHWWKHEVTSGLLGQIFWPWPWPCVSSLGLVQSQGQSDQYSSEHSVSRYNYTNSTLVYQRHWYRRSASPRLLILICCGLIEFCTRLQLQAITIEFDLSLDLWPWRWPWPWNSRPC